uniref:G_PROTEIN_RECEP_F1_2 domain-containing protein n=1 Tax=Steinernema glaseri TaxID=37863 RepID=A0A1I7YAW0_9BILA
MLNLRTEISVYFILGSLAACLNVAVILIVLCTKALRSRKEFIMIIGYCLVDALIGIGHVLIAIYRLHLTRARRGQSSE